MNVSSDGSAGLSRREFVKRSALTGAGMGLWTSAQSLLGYRRANAEDAPSGSVSTNTSNGRKPKVKSKRLFIKAPRPRAVVWAKTFYTKGEGTEMVCVISHEMRDDIHEDFKRMISADNGRTWSDPEPFPQIAEKTPRGMHRQAPAPGWVDPGTGRLLVMVVDGVLPNDSPLDGMTQWRLLYRVSTDGGRTFEVDEPVVQKGDYTPEHPMKGVHIGKNGVMMGATACRPIRTRRGNILVPVTIAATDADGNYHRPGGGYTYEDAAVLIGTWVEGMKIEWDLSGRVAADPARSTRGMTEPALAEMPDGRILMVIRGSNDVKPHLPGYKWCSVSGDGGFHWTEPKPWTYADGSNLFSPSSCSQLLKHSNGRCYWIGNISPNNPRGNGPRYPLVIGEVDPQSLLLIKDSVAVIDTKGPDDHPHLQLSNFLAREDRLTRDIVLDVTRFLSKGIAAWDGDAYVYRIEP